MKHLVYQSMFTCDELVDKMLEKLKKIKMTPEQQLQYEIILAKNASIKEMRDEHDKRLILDLTKKMRDEDIQIKKIEKITGLSLEEIQDYENFIYPKYKSNFTHDDLIERTLKKLDESKMTPDQRMCYQMTLAKNASFKAMKEEEDRLLIERVTRETILNLAKKYKKQGVENKIIEDATGLSLEEIEEL